MRFEITRFDPATGREGLLSLWRDNLYTAATGRSHLLERRFDWLYGDSGEGAATTWVAHAHAAGADQPAPIVGCASLYPRRVLVGGQEMPAGTGCDFAVAREHRVFGPALALQRKLVSASFDDGFQFLFVRPDQASIGLFRRVGYRELGHTERWVKVLRPERFAEDINNSPLVVALSRLAAKGLEAVDQAFRLPHLRELFRLRPEILADTDPRFDQLWIEARPHHRLAEVRSAELLSRRYARIPTQRHQFFCLADGDRLVGYVVFSVEGNGACVADLLARDNESSLDLLLVEFVAAMHREGMNAISVVFLENERMRSRLKRLFFLKRERLRPILVYLPEEAPEHIRSTVLSGRDWLLFDGGMDI